jgi:hypothetical protein
LRDTRRASDALGSAHDPVKISAIDASAIARLMAQDT